MKDIVKELYRLSDKLYLVDESLTTSERNHAARLISEINEIVSKAGTRREHQISDKFVNYMRIGSIINEVV